MFRSAIIIFCVNYCAFLFSQNVSFSRPFETFRKNVPIALINNHAHYFHVLRYNKDIHDLTIERRNKPSAEIIAFTPLKMDSVNASWFDYENLDYIFYEHNHQIYFVFEKVLNTRREIYLKIIDSTGRSTGFNQLAILEMDKATENLRFEFKITGQDKILIVGIQDYIGGSSKRVALLYDPVKREKLWVKKLAPENPGTGYSQGFVCNSNNDLYYLMLKQRISSYKRKYMDHRQVEVPVFSHELMAVTASFKNSTSLVRTEIAQKDIGQMYGLTLCADDKDLALILHFSHYDSSGREKAFFLTQKWSNDLSRMTYSKIIPLDERIEKQLTFYDGGDYKSAADKEFSVLHKFRDDSLLYILSERKEQNYYKELLLLKIDLNTGQVLNQEIIPRKVFYYSARTRYKNVGEGIRSYCGNNYQVLLPEHPRNFEKAPRDFRYNRYKRVSGAVVGKLAAYGLSSGGNLEKKIITIDEQYTIIPLRTQSNQCDVIIYLNDDEYEKFAILNWNPG